MSVLQRPGDKTKTIGTVATSELQGLAGWTLEMLRSWRGHRATPRKQLQLVETLPLGGKRQLMLVTCGSEAFLVGGGLESVETIVRLKGGVSLDATPKNLDGLCE